MRGRRVLMESFVAQGVRHIFGNPGTTETPLLDSLPAYPQIDYVMALHEGVAVGAASFYAQASRRVTVANLHVAPGLGNGIGALYGALKANSPVVVTAGQQDTRMRLRNPVLGHDLVAMAAPVTKWSVQIERADEIAPILRRAFKVATDAPQGPVFVSLPIDVMEQETSVEAAAPDRLWRAAAPDPKGVAELAAALLKSRNPAIVVGDDVARAGATGALVALVEQVGAAVWFESLRHHASFPTGHPNYRTSLPGDAAQIRKALEGADLVLLLGGPFFEDIWYADGSPFPDGAAVLQIEQSPERLAFNHRLDAGLVGDLAGALAALSEAVRAGASVEFRAAAQRRNAMCADRRAQEKEAYRTRLEKAWNREPASMPRFAAELRWTLAAGVAVGLPSSLVVLWGHAVFPPALWTTGVKAAVGLIAGTALSAAYASALVWLWTAPAASHALSRLAPAGRMTLTNFFLQYAIMVLLFHHQGLALYKQVGSAVSLGLTIAIYVAQLGLSRWWLSRFSMGPLEWAWRWLTYGSPPAMRLAAVVRGPRG